MADKPKTTDEWVEVILKEIYATKDVTNLEKIFGSEILEINERRRIVLRLELNNLAEIVMKPPVSDDTIIIITEFGEYVYENYEMSFIKWKKRKFELEELNYQLAKKNKKWFTAIAVGALFTALGTCILTYIELIKLCQQCQ